MTHIHTHRQRATHTHMYTMKKERMAGHVREGDKKLRKGRYLSHKKSMIFPSEVWMLGMD